jgi:hypothetical protein
MQKLSIYVWIMVVRWKQRADDSQIDPWAVIYAAEASEFE